MAKKKAGSRAQTKVPVAQLERRLASDIPRLVLIEGPEDFLRREAIEIILTRVHGPDGGHDNVTRLGGARADDVDLTELFDELKTPSLFGGDRTVILSDASAHVGREPDAWLAFLKEGWSGATLILCADKIDARTKVGKALKKSAWIVPVDKPFHRPPPWESNSPPWKNPLNEWLVARARRQGLQLDSPTAHLLMSRVGTSLADLAAMIERFETVLPPKGEIDRDLVEKHTPEGEESNLFELVDALFSGDRAVTLRGVRDVLGRGSVDGKGVRVVDPQALFLQFVGTAIYRARQIRDIHRVIAGGGDDDAIMREAGVARFLLPRLKQQARLTRPETLARLVHDLFEADRDLKSGRGPKAAELMERLAARVG